MVAPNKSARPAESAGPAGPNVSPRKLRANRRNARKSTGPRTAAGKARACHNSISHGIFCQHLLVGRGEDPDKLAFIRAGFMDAVRPQNLLELALMDRMVTAQWRLNRCQASEALLHETAAEHERATARRRARKVQEEFDPESADEIEQHCRDHPADPVVPQLRAMLTVYRHNAAMAEQEIPPAVTLATAMSAPDVSLDHGGLSRLAQYEQRFVNQFHRALRELEFLRARARSWAELPEGPFAKMVDFDADADADAEEDAEEDADDDAGSAAPAPATPGEGPDRQTRYSAFGASWGEGPTPPAIASSMVSAPSSPHPALSRRTERGEEAARAQACMPRKNEPTAEKCAASAGPAEGSGDAARTSVDVSRTSASAADATRGDAAAAAAKSPPSAREHR